MISNIVPRRLLSAEEKIPNILLPVELYEYSVYLMYIGPCIIEDVK